MKKDYDINDLLDIISIFFGDSSFGFFYEIMRALRGVDVMNVLYICMVLFYIVILINYLISFYKKSLEEKYEMVDEFIKDKYIIENEKIYKYAIKGYYFRITFMILISLYFLVLIKTNGGYIILLAFIWLIIDWAYKKVIIIYAGIKKHIRRS